MVLIMVIFMYVENVSENVRNKNTILILRGKHWHIQGWPPKLDEPVGTLHKQARTSKPK